MYARQKLLQLNEYVYLFFLLVVCKYEIDIYGLPVNFFSANVRTCLYRTEGSYLFRVRIVKEGVRIETQIVPTFFDEPDGKFAALSSTSPRKQRMLSLYVLSRSSTRINSWLDCRGFLRLCRFVIEVRAKSLISFANEIKVYQIEKCFTESFLRMLDARKSVTKFSGSRKELRNTS